MLSLFFPLLPLSSGSAISLPTLCTHHHPSPPPKKKVKRAIVISFSSSQPPSHCILTFSLLPFLPQAHTLVLFVLTSGLGLLLSTSVRPLCHWTVCLSYIFLFCLTFPCFSVAYKKNNFALNVCLFGHY